MKITNKTKVEECAISVRLRKCLKSCDIETIGDPLNKNTFYFAQQSVFGRMSLNELATFMKYNNLKFKGDFETDNIDWEQRKYELVKAALQGIISSNYCIEKEINIDGSLSRCFHSPDTIAEQCVTLAKEIVKKLKESEETK